MRAPCAQSTPHAPAPPPAARRRAPPAPGAPPPPAPAAARAAPPPAGGPTILHGQVLHSATKHQLEVLDSMKPWFGAEVLPLLGPPDAQWQPSDFLPDPASESFVDELAQLRARAAGVPDAALAVLVGDMVTEEALPTYMAMLNTLDGFRDGTGAEAHAYARWTRRWVAEENRHGDALNKYLWLTGRVDMRAVERTVQRLVGAGMDPLTENNAYLCLVYTSFQERATKISHGNTARLAAAAGDAALCRLAGGVAADEARHEAGYTRTVGELFRRDADGAVRAFADMMRKRVVMPAHLMDDAGWHEAHNAGAAARGGLFADFSAAAEGLGVYTAAHYCGIVEHLVRRWRVAELGPEAGLSPEGRAAQEYVCSLAERLARLAERRGDRRGGAAGRAVRFSWLGGREIVV